MPDTPLIEAVRTAIGNYLRRLSRQTRRDYGGYDVGKRRNLSIIPELAKGIAAAIMNDVALFVRDDTPADPAAVARLVEERLTGFPDERAFCLAGHTNGPQEEAREELTLAIMLPVLRAYSGTVITKPTTPVITSSGSNGWMIWQQIQSSERPQYNWRRTWPDKIDDDFTGYDGERPIGRIFRIGHVAERDKWFWLLAGNADRTLARRPPVNGWENTHREAACRVERQYDEMVEANQKAAAR